MGGGGSRNGSASDEPDPQWGGPNIQILRSEMVSSKGAQLACPMRDRNSSSSPASCSEWRSTVISAEP